MSFFIVKPFFVTLVYICPHVECQMILVFESGGGRYVGIAIRTNVWIASR